MTVETLELRVHLLPHLAISQASVALEQARPFKVSSRCTNILCTAQCLHAPLQSSCRKSQGFLKLPCMQFQTCHLYSPYVCPLCQRTSETPLLGFGVAQATLHLDMKMYDESALGMLALMFPNPPRKRHNIHTKMEALDIASILYLSLHHILYHFIHVPFISFISCAKIAFLFQRKLPVTKAKRPSIRSIWELRQKAKPFEESAVFTCCARSLCC